MSFYFKYTWIPIPFKKTPWHQPGPKELMSPEETAGEPTEQTDVRLFYRHGPSLLPSSAWEPYNVKESF